MALRTLAPIYERGGRFDDAVATYRRYAELSGSAEARYEVARVLAAAGRAEEALDELARVDIEHRMARQQVAWWQRASE